MKRTWMFKLVLGLFLCVSVFAYLSAPWGTRTEAQAATSQASSAATFELVLDGQSFGFFDKCAGIGSSSEVVVQPGVGHDGQRDKNDPGKVTFHNITLSRPITSASSLWDWRLLIDDGHPELAKRNGSITFTQGAGVDLARWNIVNAWPISVTNQVAREVAVIAVESVVRVQ